MSHDIVQLNLWPHYMNYNTLRSQSFENRNIEGASEIVCQTINICVQLRHLCFIGWPQLRLLPCMMDDDFFSNFLPFILWWIKVILVNSFDAKFGGLKIIFLSCILATFPRFNFEYLDWELHYNLAMLANFMYLKYQLLQLDLVSLVLLPLPYILWCHVK